MADAEHQSSKALAAQGADTMAIFMRSTQSYYDEERLRRRVMLSNLARALKAKCEAHGARTGMFGGADLPAVTASVRIGERDVDHFREVAKNIGEALGLPQDDRVVVTGSVSAQQKCDSSCDVDYGPCSCPWEHSLGVALKRIRE